MKIKNSKSKSIYFFILALAFLFLLLPSITHAQGVDIGIFPPIFQIETSAPSTIKLPLSIDNFSDQTTNFNIYLKAFTSSKTDNGQIEYISDPNSLTDNFLLQRVKILDSDLPITSVSLSPTEKKDLTLKIEIPLDQPRGDYYFSVIFSSTGESENNSSSTFASGGISSNVLLSVGPQGKTQGNISEFSSPFFVNSGPVAFSVALKNTSDHYITPKGNILIKNFFGQTIGKVDLLNVNILSNSSRRIPDSLQSVTVNSNDYDRIKDIVEKNNLPVAIWPEKFLLGPYNATLNISLSEKGPHFTKTITFFAFPAEFLLGLMIIIGIVIFVGARVRKNLYQKS